MEKLTNDWKLLKYIINIRTWTTRATIPKFRTVYFAEHSTIVKYEKMERQKLHLPKIASYLI